MKHALSALLLSAVMLFTGSITMPLYGLGDAYVYGDEAAPAGTSGTSAVTYTLNAQLIDSAGMPGVYKVTARKGDSISSGGTIGIPSIAKQTLADNATKETPAIIMGAATGFEKKTGPTDYEKINNRERIAPYKYFRYGIVEEEAKDAYGAVTKHKKLSGFDGSYYIVRVDLTELLNGIESSAGKYLHVKQENNKALMVAVGFDGTTYSNGGNKTGSYPLKNSWAALKDSGTNEKDTNTPYFDVIMLSSNKLVSGADAGSEGALNGDIKLSFYVDGTEDYHPELNALDPNNMPTFPYTPKGSNVTYDNELAYNNALLTKYYEDSKVSSGESATSYLVKGSDLEIDSAIDVQNEWKNNIAGDDGKYQGFDWSTENADFWSMEKAISHQPYNDHMIKLICEVPVLGGLSISSTGSGVSRKVILDVNSFDIQIANNKKSEQDQTGITINSGSELSITDSTNTAGAELAIGNNATMLIKKDGVLTIDEKCTAEVEYDAATVTDGSALPDLVNGEITIQDGGKLINRGVVNIEGTESKPVMAGEPAPKTSMATADMVIEHGGMFDNYGCLSLKGVLYVMGTLNNYGKYADIIHAGDPDKGYIDYHKGIQVTWKDVVANDDGTRKDGVEPGVLNVGIDGKRSVQSQAALNNYGDIVLVPGTLNLYGSLTNKKNSSANYSGHLYICPVTEAIVPIVPSKEDPLTVEKRIAFKVPVSSVFNNNGSIANEEGGHIGTATVALIHNGILGELTPTQERLCKISFDPNGGTQVGDQEIVSGCSAARPNAPTKANCMFTGWYTDAELMRSYGFDTAVTSDMTLYAGWVSKEGQGDKLAVIFDSNGGSAVETQWVESNAAITKPAAPSRSGYDFAGWFKEPSLVNEWNFESDKVTADTTLYAKWKEASGGGGGGGSAATDDQTAADAVTARINGLPESVTVNDKAAIEAARAAFDALTAAQKALVSKDALAKLEAAEAALKTAEDVKAVEDAIEALPEASAVTTANKKAIDSAKAAYDELPEAGKAAVSADKKAKLDAAVTALAKAELKEASNINKATVTAKDIRKASKLGATKITLGKKTKKIARNAFKGTNIKTIVIKSKKLTKKRVKGSLKGSKVKTVKVNVGSKKLNKKYVKKYKKFFAKKNSGKKITVK